MDEQQAALKLQKIQRGNSARAEFRDIRDEEARKQWVTYYVAIGNYAEARELGWEGDEPAEAPTREAAVSVPKPVESGEAATTGPMLATEAEAKEKAALLMQAATRGKAARDEYRDMRDEEARKQWVAYYLASGDYAQARELGWDEEEDQQAEAATKLAAVRKGQLARRSLTGASSEVVDDEPVLVEAGSESAINGDGSADPDAEGGDDGEKWGQDRENELALQKAEDAIPIFSARWFGQIWDALKPKEEGDPADKFSDREKAAAVIVQCWARVVLARVAVKNQGRKYRLLALYAHIEDKNAMKIQHAFRNKQASTAEIAAAELVEIEQVAASVAANAIAAGAAMASTEEGEMAAAPAVSAPSAPASAPMPTKVEMAKAGMSVPEVPPPPAEIKGVPQGLPPPVDKASSLERKVAEIQANHAATVMQKVQREAAKAEQMKKLQGSLFKRSLQVPRYQRRWMYVSNSTVDGLALCYREKDADGSKTESVEKRIPLASITEIALVSEGHYEFSLDSTIRSKKYLFRSETRAELEMWLNGLAELAPA